MIISNLEHVEAMSEDKAIQGGFSDLNAALNLAKVSQDQAGVGNNQGVVLAQINSINDNVLI
ncbi:MAG: hypothetical protein GVY04_21255 [Cyanobacteria bacterium]|jgi:hypothetical protein|nr:hypothetical protein [Cyanobacteria bacterium GSL.Bin1]